MNDEITIREYEEQDKAVLLTLLALNTPEYFHPDEAKDFVEYLGEHREDYYVAEAGGEVIAGGGVNYFPEKELACISWDVVHPDRQGRGVGSALLKHRMNRVRAQPEFKVLVVRTSQLAFPFYEKAGFQLEFIEKDYWAPGFDLYQMKLAW